MAKPRRPTDAYLPQSFINGMQDFNNTRLDKARGQRQWRQAQLNEAKERYRQVEFNERLDQVETLVTAWQDIHGEAFPMDAQFYDLFD